VANPLCAVSIRGPQRGTLPVAASLLQIDQANVELLALKVAEDGNGLIVRLAQTEGRQTVARITLPQFSVRDARRTNLVEEDERKVEHGEHWFNVTVPARSVVTIRLVGRVWPAARLR
jgi:alpha-mannosidase